MCVHVCLCVCVSVFLGGGWTAGNVFGKNEGTAERTEGGRIENQ